MSSGVYRPYPTQRLPAPTAILPAGAVTTLLPGPDVVVAHRTPYPPPQIAIAHRAALLPAGAVTKPIAGGPLNRIDVDPYPVIRLIAAGIAALLAPVVAFVPATALASIPRAPATPVQMPETQIAQFFGQPLGTPQPPQLARYQTQPYAIQQPSAEFLTTDDGLVDIASSGPLAWDYVPRAFPQPPAPGIAALLPAPAAYVPPTELAQISAIAWSGLALPSIEIAPLIPVIGDSITPAALPSIPRALYPLPQAWPELLTPGQSLGAPVGGLSIQQPVRSDWRVNAPSPSIAALLPAPTDYVLPGISIAMPARPLVPIQQPKANQTQEAVFVYVPPAPMARPSITRRVDYAAWRSVITEGLPPGSAILRSIDLDQTHRTANLDDASRIVTLVFSSRGSDTSMS